VNFSEDLSSSEITLILNENIESVEIIPSEVDDEKIVLIHSKLDSLFSIDSPEPKTSRSRLDLIETRNKLVEWLEKNRLQVKLDKESEESDEHLIINILDSVYIHPPYDIKNCISNNEIVLNRVRNLMSNRM